jgi:hypothetical protein
MTSETYKTYEPISISPADGWRAAYIHEPREGGAGWSAEPLIAWAVYEVTTRPIKGSTAHERSEGRQILGVVFGEGYAQCPEETSNFWRYLAPGNPDPSPAEIKAEQAERWPERGVYIPGVGRVGR